MSSIIRDRLIHSTIIICDEKRIEMGTGFIVGDRQRLILTYDYLISITKLTLAIILRLDNLIIEDNPDYAPTFLVAD